MSQTDNAAFERDCLELVAKRWWTAVELEAFVAKWRDIKGYPISVTAAEERTGTDVEQSLDHVLSDLAKDKLSKRSAEVLRDSAEGSIKRQTSSEGLGRALRSR